MGSGLCRTDEGPRAVRGFDGLYRKIVFNYATQWTTRYSDKSTKSEKKNLKHNIKSGKKKLIISGPFPADPDRLHGEKWQYVILTRLDTEPPPERPPRTKRCRRQETVSSGVSGIVRWGSQRRRSFGRRRPPRSRQLQQHSADQPTGPKSSERVVVESRGTEENTVAVAAVKKTAPPTSGAAVEKRSMWIVLWSGAVVAGRTFAARPNGLLKSVVRANAMANDLSS